MAFREAVSQLVDAADLGQAHLISAGSSHTSMFSWWVGWGRPMSYDFTYMSGYWHAASYNDRGVFHSDAAVSRDRLEACKISRDPDSELTCSHVCSIFLALSHKSSLDWWIWPATLPLDGRSSKGSANVQKGWRTMVVFAIILSQSICSLSQTLYPFS